MAMKKHPGQWFLLNGCTSMSLKCRTIYLQQRLLKQSLPTDIALMKIPLKSGTKVMLSTEHHHREYIQAKSGHVAKFMPHSDGPFLVTNVNPTKSSYTLDLPNKLNQFPTFHASQLSCFNPNDADLFPSWALAQPGPSLTRPGNKNG